MKTFLLIFTAVFMMSFNAMAAGSITLIGTLRSFSPQTFDISDGTKIYSLDRTKIGTAQDKTLKALKVGSPAQVTVNFNAISSVRDLK